MTQEELLKKVRELEIRSKRLTTHLFSGEYHTAFKGRGMLFKEVREYQAGDDVRFIDWNVSARMNGAYSKLFEEERELSVYLLIDSSASSLFGTHHQTKKDMITEICAVIAFSALSNNDKTGLVFFTDKVEKHIPAATGRPHVLYMVREMLTFEPTGRQTNIVTALRYLSNVTRHKSIVFILSDFADAGYHEALRVAAKRHDVIGIMVSDRHDSELPKIGLVPAADPETGQVVWLDTSDPAIRNYYHNQFAQVQRDAEQTFQAAGADLLKIGTGEDYVKALQQFFIRRA